MALTDKNKRFVEEYMRDMNATQAYIRAGYCPNTAKINASKVLDKEEVKKAIAVKQAELAAVCGWTTYRIIKRYEDIIDDPDTKPRDVIMALEKLTKLLGLDQPQKLEVTTDGTAAIGIIEIPAASEGEI